MCCKSCNASHFSPYSEGLHIRAAPLERSWHWPTLLSSLGKFSHNKVTAVYLAPELWTRSKSAREWKRKTSMARSWVAWIPSAWHSHHRQSSVLSCSVTADQFCGLHPVPAAVTRSMPQEKTVNITAKGEWMQLSTPSPAPPHIKAPVMFPLSHKLGTYVLLHSNHVTIKQLSTGKKQKRGLQLRLHYKKNKKVLNYLIA